MRAFILCSVRFCVRCARVVLIIVVYTDRCLVKMQKRNKGNCPMCRAPTVLTADRCESPVLVLNDPSR
jgi:hypothetical protein